jgi:hypothetical protein
MRSPTLALLWEIWHRHRTLIWVCAGLTVLGRAFDDETLNELLAMAAFLLLFGAFAYTESDRDRGLGSFPRRLFVLPVSTLRLVGVPMLAAVASVELLYLVWMDRLPGGDPENPILGAVLLAAFVVLSQAVLWTLTRLGALRLVAVGAIAVALFAVALVPSLPGSTGSPWRSGSVLAGLVAAIVVVVFLATWAYIAGLRSGSGFAGARLEPLVGRITDKWPRRRRPFASPASAQVWFEWRCSGPALPLLVGSVLVAVAAPVSWLVRHDAGDTMQLLLLTLAAPVVLAVPVGIAFSRPRFWSDDLSVPAFVAVRPLSTEDLIAVKLRVAAMSAAVAWLIVIAFVCTWLPLWANLDWLSGLAMQLWVLHDHSVVAVCGMGVLVVAAGMLMSWRFLVTRLWSGMMGDRGLFVGSVVSTLAVGIAAAVFDAYKLPGWLLESPDRLPPALWLVALAVSTKYWLAAYAWRGIAPRRVWRYLLIWLAGTTCFVTLALIVWGVVRIYLPMDIYRVQGLMLLLALMAVPLVRVGLAPSCLERNRHR